MARRGQNTLPADIVSEILLRLPLKSIFRFRSACRRFSAITSRPSFLHSHAVLKSANPSFFFHSPDFLAPHFVIVNINGGVSGEDTATPLTTAKGKKITTFPLELRPVASCDGLVCLFHSVQLTYYVFHPLTMECIAVPPLPPAVPPMTDEIPILVAYVCGFYYHNSSGEYRMMASLGGSHFAVHSLGTKTWREIDNFPYRPPPCDGPRHSVRHSRCLYWVACKYSTKKFDIVVEKSAIVMFDIEAEELSQMAFPREVPSGADDRNCLINVDGSIGLCRVGSGLDIEIWVVEDLTAGEKIWSKKYTVDIESMACPSDLEMCSVGLRPMNCYPKDGEILLRWDVDDAVKYGFILFNFRRNTYRTVDVEKLLPSKHCQICNVLPLPYIKSLISFENWRELDADKNAFPDLASFRANGRSFLPFVLFGVHYQMP